MRLLTWNLASRRVAAPAQVAWLSAQDVDAFALTEIRSTMAVELSGLLEAAGWHVQLSGWPTAGRVAMCALATKTPWTPQAPPVARFPDRVAAATAPDGLTLWCAYVPVKQTADEAKRRVLDGMADALTGRARTVVMGDFNSPAAEFADGTVQTFGQARPGAIPRAGSGARRLHEAERRFFGPPHAGHVRLVDAYAALHPCPEPCRVEGSWLPPQRGVTREFRLDHALHTADLVATEATYLHAPREGRLSDHSALAVTITDPAPARPPIASLR